MYETLAAYLPAAKYIVPKTPFPRNKAYIFAFHPHGRMFYAYAMFSQLDEIWREPIKLVQGKSTMLSVPALIGSFDLELLDVH
jgi:hypothetical protein